MQHKATLTKRVLSLIMVIAMMLTLAPLSVFAAETTRIVYFQNNWLWTDVRAYSFDAAGNYDVAWPGAAMTFVENDGTYDIYKFEVPATATTVIINGIKNDGSDNRDQTPNLTQFPTGVCHNMMWNGGNSVGTFAYTPPTGNDTDPSTEPIVTEPTTPAVTYDYIIAGAPAGVFGTEWDPANKANAMTKNADGIYEKVYEDVGIGTLKFKVTDGTWSNCWGGANADADGNYVLSVTAISDVTIRFNPTTKTVTAEAVPTGEEQEPVEYVTLHYRNTNVWETVNAYVWDMASNTTLNGAWPGEPITETEGHANWYTIEVTEQNAAAGIGFIFGDGTNQTADIVITKSGEYWYDNGIFKTAPASWADGTVTLVDYEVTLHFANTLGWGGVNLYTWEPFSNAGWPGEATAQDADGFYTASYTYKAPAGKGLNFIFNGGGQTKDLALKPTDFVDGKCERWVVINGSVTDDYGNVRYTADILTDPEAIAISPVVKDKTVTFEYKGATTDKVSVFGTWDNWAKGVTMTPNSHGVFSVTLDNVPTGMHLYKFVVNGAWITDPLNNWIETNAEGNPDSAFLISDPSLDTNTVTVRVHFDAPSAEWNVCAWGADNLEPQYNFVNDVATITLDGRASQYIAFKVRKSIKGNSWAKQSGEIRIDLSNTTSGTIDVYVGAESAGYPVSQKLNGDVVYANKVKSIELDYDKNTVTVSTVKAVSDPETAFSFFYDGKASDIVKSVTTNGGSYVFALNETLDLVTLYKYTVRFNEQVKFTDYDYAININTVYASDKFADEFTYTGTDLGATYTTEITDFVVWAPTAEKVEVALYSTGSDDEEGAAFLGAYAMEKGDKGEWRVGMAGDLKNVYYTYRVTVNGKEVEACDPYARSTGVNGNRAMVVDLASTNPEGWDDDKNPNPVTSYTDAVIYELHVRDFSIDDSSGISEANRGKFMAFTERGTTTAGGHKTGIDYLSELGITHLHLLPIYDYGSVDETKCENFNWGYDPVNYNVPEGSYSTNPYDGALRVNEMKQMVKALHDADISVVMDVVYNHVYDAGKFGFNQIVPRYFSRVNPDGSYSNGSGCGNDTASEREMVRKYIVESVLYWAEEYHIDGFRFDLVGLLDAETINLIVEEVHKIRPDVIFYGEGWTMGTAVEGGTNKTPMATQQNAAKTPGFAYFNDRIRNLLGGNNGQSLGFASGLTGQESSVADNFMAQPDWSTNPSQIVQYASCHDNYTLMDKIILSTKKAGIDAEAIKMNNLAAAVYMTSQGIPFIHAGEEFLREKLTEDGGRSENSYNAPDSVNHIEWSNLDNATYANNSKYYQGLIAFRKAHPALRMATTAEVMSNITYKWVTNEVVMFTINAAAIEGETVEKIVVIFNATKSPVQIALPAGDWNVVVNDTKAGTETLSTATSAVNVPAISAMVLTQGEIEVEPTTYTLTIDANGGQMFNGNSVFVVGAPEGDEVDESCYDAWFAATREGYTLTRWNTKADGSGEDLAIPYTMPAHDVTFYAIWEENKPVIEKFDIAFAQIDMGNALGMNFAFPAVEDIDFTGAYAEATMAGSTQTIPADKWTTASIGGAAHYVFGYSNIAAKQMADEITIVIYNADGEAISNEYVDSIQSYVMRNVDKKDAESKALMVDMLNYGAAAQTYYGYNAEDLANAQLSDAQKAYGTAELAEITDGRVKGANYLGTRLELGSSIGMQMNFAGTTADMYAIVEFTNHGDTEISERVAPTEIDGVYLINITQIAVADGRIPVTVTVYNADGTVYGTATDSMASYIARMSNADSLYENIMKFSDSAYAYLH